MPLDDRAGLVHKLLNSLNRANVTPLAHTCAITSNPLMVPFGDLIKAILSRCHSIQIPEDRYSRKFLLRARRAKE